jgi:hypothetical protein
VDRGAAKCFVRQDAKIPKKNLIEVSTLSSKNAPITIYRSVANVYGWFKDMAIQNFTPFWLVHDN